MDETRFDAITRALTAVRSRRGAAHVASAIVLGGAPGLLSRTYSEATEAGGRCKPKCSECNRCKQGPCRNMKHGKVCKKGKCTAKDSGLACSTGTCQAGVCTAPPVSVNRTILPVRATAGAGQACANRAQPARRIIPPVR